MEVEVVPLCLTEYPLMLKAVEVVPAVYQSSDLGHVLYP